MGEGNRKTKRLLEAQPTCTYCGGLNASASRDHCPPITAFDDRWRPEGMEFGACEACHQGTREMDAVIGFVSRIRGVEGKLNGKAEIEKAISALVRKYPHLLEHLQVDAQRVQYAGSIEYVAHIGPDSALHRVMDAFAARMGLAAYRQLKGPPAPASARIVCRWDTNVGLDNDEALNNFLQSLGLPQTLKQGKKARCGAIQDMACDRCERARALRRRSGVQGIIRSHSFRGYQSGGARIRGYF